MKTFKLTIMIAAVLALSACETLQNRGNKELIGGGAGAVLGGLAGSQIGGGSGQRWATGVGVLLGALFLGERPGWNALLALFIIVSGVVVARLRFPGLKPLKRKES